MLAADRERAALLRELDRGPEPLRIAEEESWSDLAAVIEESIHGQDDVRTSLAAPYVRKLYAERAAEVLRRGRLVWSKSSRITMGAGAITRSPSPEGE